MTLSVDFITVITAVTWIAGLASFRLIRNQKRRWGLILTWTAIWGGACIASAPGML